MEVTWWGHATCTVEDSGVRVLTDPLFTRRLAHLRRRRGALPPPDAARADVVLISHLHADHLHLPSLARLAPDTLVVVPRARRTRCRHCAGWPSGRAGCGWPSWGGATR